MAGLPLLWTDWASLGTTSSPEGARSDGPRMVAGARAALRSHARDRISIRLHNPRSRADYEIDP